MISGSAKPLDAACEFEREIIRRGASYILHLQDAGFPHFGSPW